ncbi:MAG: sigma-70 family RNA polymerase sigma factor [Rickettsiales bacterium]|nr:sigma-70 family RNA polymerase sigma factor [Rickettsiales bacterium]
MKQTKVNTTVDIDSYVVNSAKYYSLKLVAKGYYNFYETDDLEQEILALFLYQIKKYKYDESKSSYKNWVSILMENIFKELIRKSKLHKKYFSKVSLNDTTNTSENYKNYKTYKYGNNSTDNNSSEIIDLIEDTNANTFEEYYKSTRDKKLLQVINNLPDDLKELCRLLRDKNVTDIAKQLKISRDTVYSKIHKIKKIFKDNGIDNCE